MCTKTWIIETMYSLFVLATILHVRVEPNRLLGLDLDTMTVDRYSQVIAVSLGSMTNLIMTNQVLSLNNDCFEDNC